MRRYAIGRGSVIVMTMMVVMIIDKAWVDVVDVAVAVAVAVALRMRLQVHVLAG